MCDCDKFPPDNMIFQEVTKFAKHFEQVFWLKSKYCMKRNTEHPNEACKACESLMMCTMGLHLHKQSKAMKEMTCINCANQEKLANLEGVLSLLRKENNKLKGVTP